MRTGMDYHVHTYYQRCGNETLTIPNIVRKAEECGITSMAITDHLNHLGQLPAFRFIREDISKVETGIDLFFGVELNFQGCDGEFAYNQQIHDDWGFEVVIGGIHSTYTDSLDMKLVLDIQHRHFMKTLENPLLDVLVHPFWFGRNEVAARPPEWWEELIATIPDSHIDAWATASAKNRCAIELNVDAIFYYPPMSKGFQAAYIDFVERLKDAGAIFSVGSDAHDITKVARTDYAEGLLDAMRVPENQIFRPEHR
ncbi:MAG: PHP domain-containing protein [Armatimonadetes bacterium]|nr:PHP domain-containing protein [Armatimonadota bacterium]